MAALVIMLDFYYVKSFMTACNGPKPSDGADVKTTKVPRLLAPEGQWETAYKCRHKASMRAEPCSKCVVLAGLNSASRTWRRSASAGFEPTQYYEQKTSIKANWGTMLMYPISMVLRAYHVAPVCIKIHPYRSGVVQMRRIEKKRGEKR